MRKGDVLGGYELVCKGCSLVDDGEEDDIHHAEEMDEF